MFKKGAMFGLDARIALAIFGALSVISGATLYSAIQEAKITTIISDANEINKAVEAFMLDTGQDLKYVASSVDYEGLISNADNVPNWKGPYASLPGTLTNGVGMKYLTHSDYGLIFHRYFQADLGGASVSNCTARPCYYWLMFTDIGEDTVKIIDEKIDGSASPTTGRVRITTANPERLYLQGPLMLSQP